VTTQATPDPNAFESRRRSGGERRRQVADAALAVLAEHGARGLTHRAVDEAAGLPQGSTSNVFRSRAALLDGALERHAAMDFAAAGPGAEDSAPLAPISHEQAARIISAGVEGVLGARPRSVARFELLLESTRRDELREPIEAARARFAAATSRVLAATGCKTPERHAAQLLAVLDGIVIAELHGDDAALDHEAITELIGRTLASC
jgi:DNA-binding transcriptional regulator YbjK